jgi:ATP-binding cassette subfamily B protein
MLKLFKYLKPYKWLILIVFVLLFGQAMADLSLPTYTADIINVGVQQNGIVNSVPTAMSETEMGHLTLFMSDTEKTSVRADYTLLNKQTLSVADYSQDVKKYPALDKENVYVLNSISSDENKKLDSIFGKSIIAVAAIESKGLSSFGITVPAGHDQFTFISQQPALLAGIQKALGTQVAALPSSVVTQTAAAYLKVQYTELRLNIGSIQSAYMWHIGILMILLTLGSAAASLSVGFLAARIAAGFGRDTRKRLFTKVENFSNAEFDKFTTASLITRTTNDVTQIQLMLVFLIRIVFYAPILGIGGVIHALQQDVGMSWIIGLALAVILTLVIITFFIVIPKYRLMQKLIDKINKVSREILSGIMVIRAFNTQSHEGKKFDDVNTDLTAVSFSVQKILVLMMPVMMFVMSGISVLIIWVGAHQVDAGSLQVGNMIAFMQYAIQIIMAFFMVSMVFIMLPRAFVSAGRIDEVISTPQSIEDPKQPVSYNGNQRGVVEFKNVCFRYPGAEDYVLKDINFTAKPKQTTAIIGSTGSGKSTLVNLIPRFYDTTEGDVLVNGENVKSVTQHDLRDTIGYVPQTTTLFSGTVETNLKYGKENATPDEITKAAEIAQAIDFIESSEQKFETSTSQGATNFSGGQKQRLSIARALVKQPDVYIFDDSFSALDFRTDAKLRQALHNETGDATVLIVSQRIGTVMNADQILVLDNGKIAGIGKHTELMKGCSVYREIAESQLSREELE